MRVFAQTPEAAAPAVPVPSLPPRVQAWNVLNQGIQEKDPEKRTLAAIALGTIGGSPEVIKLLGDSQHDSDATVRIAVVQAFGEIKTDAALPFLKDALDDTPEVSFVAAKILWDRKDRTGREIFQEVLKGERKDAPGMMTSAVRDAKHKMRNPKELALIGAKEASGALLGPASMGIGFAEEAMKDSGAPGRVVSAGFLAEDPDPYALSLLEWALQDKNWAVRAASAKAIGIRGNAESIDKLLPLLSDPKHGVRYMAAASVVRLSIHTPPTQSGKTAAAQ